MEEGKRESALVRTWVLGAARHARLKSFTVGPDLWPEDVRVGSTK